MSENRAVTRRVRVELKRLQNEDEKDKSFYTLVSLKQVSVICLFSARRRIVRLNADVVCHWQVTSFKKLGTVKVVDN